MAATSSKAEPKRAVLRMSEKDSKRLRILLAKQDKSWQTFLTEAANLWLESHGEKRLEEPR